jgi:cytochrome c biogenesis protein CcmG/thiol:disulfide interchange protein DsbE
MRDDDRDSHRARWIALAVGGVVVVLAVVLTLTIRTDPLADTKTSHLLGKSAPRFDLPTLDGAAIHSIDLVGKSVIVNFWNSWCIPCRQEHPALLEFYRQHANDSDFVMIGIVRDDSKSAIKTYVRVEGVPYVVAFDPGGTAALDFGTRGQPETYVISPSGVIVGSQYGPTTVVNLENMLGAARRSG